MKGLKHTEESKEKNKIAHLGKPAWNKGLKMNSPAWNKGMKYKTGFYSNRMFSNKEDIDKLVDFYLKTKSINKTANEFNTTRSTVYRRLKENNADTLLDREKHREISTKYRIDDSFFEKIDTRDKAYILGIIFADGNVTKEQSIRLKLTDLDLLDEIKTRIGYSDRPLYLNKKEKPQHKTSKLLVISNKKMYRDIVALGCSHNKTYKCYFPSQIPSEFKSDFFRGFFDGDGCIYIFKHKNRLSEFTSGLAANVTMVSCSEFCHGMLDELSKIGIYSKVDRDKRHDIRICQFRIRRVADVVKFYHFIYKDLDGQIFLKRKFDKYKSYIEHIKNRNAKG